MTNETNNGKVNMKTLAKVLNLSTATISKALSDSHEISYETKQRVLDTAAQLNYVPNHFASSLRKRQSNTLAIVLPEIADSFFSQAINGIESIITKHNYHALIYLTHESYEREVHMFNELSGGRVDGVLMSVASGTKDTSHIKALQEAGIPVVFFDRICEEIPAAQIKTDDLHSAYVATCHLIDQGCKNISLVTIDGYPSIFQSREEGYTKALTEGSMNLQPQSILTLSNHHTQDNVSELVKHLQEHKPDGILATVEHLATTTYMACEETGLKIPQDVKVICFTNQITAPILNPPLTTIFQPAFEMGKQAAELLFAHFAGKQIQIEKEHIVIPSQLIARGSTANN
jgi:LacI family transcriptional regulator